MLNHLKSNQIYPERRTFAPTILCVLLAAKLMALLTLYVNSVTAEKQSIFEVFIQIPNDLIYSCFILRYFFCVYLI